MTRDVPVIIIGGSLNGLGVARSLAREGMPIYVVDSSRLCVGGWSRHCTFVRARSIEGPALIQALLRLSARIGKRSVLIMTDDRAVETVSRFRDELEGLFFLNLPSRAMVHQLIDKSLFQKFAEEKGLPVPRTVILRGMQDLPLLEKIRMPAVIKPTEKRQVFNTGVQRAEHVDSQFRARVVASDMLKLAGSVVVQEWIDGPDTNLFFTLFSCDSRGEVQAIFSGRKVVCSPPGVGNTALCIPAPEEAPLLESLTRNFIRVAGLRGLGSMEYKRDARTREFVIIEPTIGRTDWQEEIATLSGVNIPLAEYRSVLGLPVDEMRSINLSVAWQSSMRHRPAPGLLPEGIRVQGGHYRPEDPVPALFHYGYERFAGRALRLIKRVIKGEPLHASS